MCVCMCVCMCVFVRVCINVCDKLFMPMSHCIRYISQPTSRQVSQSAIRLANTKGVAALTFASLNFFVLFVFVWYSFVDR